nr:SAM-dependent chlorinase/fluorinase [Candidatus Njordarchaeota archaeon]
MRKKPSVTNKEVIAENIPIITLLSDFGDRDPYVGSMKGVILSICRRTRIVDITHNVAKFNILEGGFILASVIPY